MSEVSLLGTVGQVAGVGGLALGVLLLLFREVIRKNIFPNLAQVQGYRIIRLIVTFTFLIAVAGISAWVYVRSIDAPFAASSFYSSTPKLITPDSEARLSAFPRSIQYSWQPVTGAVRYLLEVEYFDGTLNQWILLPGGNGKRTIDAPNGTSGFVGAQPGRWRVTPINTKNEKGQASDWRQFVYLQ